MSSVRRARKQTRRLGPSPRTALKIMNYMDAIWYFLWTDDDSMLWAFDGKYIIDTQGHRHYLSSHPDDVRILIRTGRL